MKIVRTTSRQDQRLMARTMANRLGVLKNSITKGRGNYTGFMGEILAAEWLGAEMRNTYNFDIMHGDLSIDVKSKSSEVIPKSFYECSVGEYNTFQRCDYYLFTRVVGRDVYLLGYLPKDEFYEMADYHREGEIDPSNGFVFRCNSYNVRIDQTRPVKDLVMVMA